MIKRKGGSRISKFVGMPIVLVITPSAVVLELSIINLVAEINNIFK